MYRFRFTVEVRYGQFAEYLKIAEQLNEIARARGWAEFTYWTPTVGRANECIGEAEYPDLATFQKESDAFGSDAEAMQVLRSTTEHVVQGSTHTELLETAPQLA
jgi:NIPSNAP